MGKLRDSRVSVRLNTRPMRNSPSATGATVEMTVVTSVMAAPSIGWVRWFVGPSQMKVHSRRVAEGPGPLRNGNRSALSCGAGAKKRSGFLIWAHSRRQIGPGEAAQADDDGGSAAVGGGGGAAAAPAGSRRAAGLRG